MEAATQSEARGGTLLLLLGALLGMSVLMNLALASKVSSLRKQNNQMTSSRHLQVGDSVPALNGHTLDGRPLSVLFDDVQIPTVLYVFSPQCGWCAKNIENLRSLIAQSGARYRVVGLSMTRLDLEAYLSKEHLSMPVLADVDAAAVSAYELSETPTTVVVSPNRKVLNVWVGAYQDGIRQQIEGFLGIHLLPCCEIASSEAKSKS